MHGEEVRLGVTPAGPSQFLIADLNNPSFAYGTTKTLHNCSIALPQSSSFARTSRFIPVGRFGQDCRQYAFLCSRRLVLFEVPWACAPAAPQARLVPCLRISNR